MRELEKRMRSGVAVVTGASGGLGKEIARQLARQGMQVVGLGRRIDSLKLAAEETKGNFLTMITDVADCEAVKTTFEKIRKDVGPVTILINNAAVYPHRDVLDETADSFMKTVAVNLGGPFACSRAALDDMVEQGFGRIINVGSFADIAPAPAAAAYSVSKGSMRILTRALVADLADRFPDIVINDWMPGILNTTMGLPDGLDPAKAAAIGVQLALWHDPDMNGLVFDQDRSVLPPLGMKRRLLNKALRQSPRQFSVEQ